MKLNFIEYKGKKVLYGFDKDTKKYNLIRYNISIIGNTLCYCVYLIYLLTYAILLVTRATFEENYASKDSYNYNIINTINNCIFILFGISIISYIFVTFYFCKITSNDINCRRYLKLIFTMIFIVIHAVFEGFLIWKLVLSYKIAGDSTTWFMKMDIAFIVLDFLYITCSLIEFIYYYKETIPNYINDEIILTEINDIQIEYYSLPRNYNKFSKSEQRNYILQNITEISVKNNLTEITNRINLRRPKLSISPLSTEYQDSLLGFMFTIPSEAFFYDYKYIFRLGNDIYLIRCSYDEFSKKIILDDKDLFKIICNENLTFISFATKKNEENVIYIYLWNKEYFNGDSDEFAKKYNFDWKNIKDYDNNENNDNKINIKINDDLKENLIINEN